MKKFNFIKRMFLLPSVAIVALTSCEDKPVTETTSFALSSKELTTIGTETVISHNSPAAGDMIKINVTMDGSLTWKVQAKTGSSIFTITPTGDQIKSGEISIQVKPNTTFSERQGKVVISDSYTKTDREITFTQAASGTPVLRVTPSNKVPNIAVAGVVANFSITTDPSTPLTFEPIGNASDWITPVTPATEGSTNTWKISENANTMPRTAKIAIKYDGGKKALDTLYFSQLAATVIPTPQPVVVAASVHAQNAVVTWANNPAVNTVEILVNGKTMTTVPTADTKLYVSGLMAGTEYIVSMTGKTLTGSLDTKTVTFTTKLMTDTYIFKDSKLQENIATWLSALRSPKGITMNQGVVLVNGGITYDTLAMITDLILTYQFGGSANGIVDLLQVPNITRLQIGRGYYDEGVTITKEKLDAVLTKANFSKLTTIQIFAPGVPPAGSTVPAAVQTAFQELCTAQGYTFVNPMVKGLKFPNALPDPTAVTSTVTTVNELGLADRALWKAVSWTTQEPTGEGTNGKVAQMIDGKLDTYYHSQWQNMAGIVLALPHEIVIDMGLATKVSKVVMTNRQSGNRDSRPEVYSVSFSNDVPLVYPTADQLLATIFPEPKDMTWSAPVEIINNADVASTAAGICANTFTLTTPVTARCVKISITRVQAPNLATNFSEFGVK